jgi:hypothetical protein
MPINPAPTTPPPTTIFLVPALPLATAVLVLVLVVGRGLEVVVEV